MKKLTIYLGTLFTVLPAVALAQDTPAGELLATIGSLLNTAVAVLLVAAVAVFFLGLIGFIFSAGNDEGRKKGIQRMIWGIIALFVFASIWGLVAFLQNTIGLDDQSVQSFDAPNVGGNLPAQF